MNEPELDYLTSIICLNFLSFFLMSFYQDPLQDAMLHYFQISLGFSWLYSWEEDHMGTCYH